MTLAKAGGAADTARGGRVPDRAKGRVVKKCSDRSTNPECEVRMAEEVRNAEVDQLVLEMERVDAALARCLADHGGRQVKGHTATSALDFARLQVQVWCADAARRGLYDPEVLAATLHAVETMDRPELAAFIRRLVGAAAPVQRPAA